MSDPEKAKLPIMPKDVCQNCCRSFAWAKSKRGWCYWCENPAPKTRLIVAPVPINSTETRKPKVKSSFKPGFDKSPKNTKQTKSK